MLPYAVQLQNKTNSLICNVPGSMESLSSLQHFRDPERMNQEQASHIPPSQANHQTPFNPPSPSNSQPPSETTKTSSEHTHSSDPATTSSHNNPPWRSGKDSQSRRRTRLIYLLGSNIHNRSAYQLRRYKSLEMLTVFQQHARYSSSLSTC